MSTWRTRGADGDGVHVPNTSGFLIAVRNNVWKTPAAAALRHNYTLSGRSFVHSYSSADELIRIAKVNTPRCTVTIRFISVMVRRDNALRVSYLQTAISVIYPGQRRFFGNGTLKMFVRRCRNSFLFCYVNCFKL